MRYRKNHRRKQLVKSQQPLPCPSRKCDGELRLQQEGKWLRYVCTRFPKCKYKRDAFQYGPWLGKPKGEPAGRVIVAARVTAHCWFDRLWEVEQAPMTRKEAYEWLAEQLGMAAKECHIGKFDVRQCERVIEAVKRYLDSRDVA